jgi:hypothetical protein
MIRKKWTKKELRRLKIAYHMGANYHMLCQILEKSATSINKQLCREGIRPLGSAKKGKKKESFWVSLDMVWQEIHRQEADHPLEEEIPPAKILKPIKKPVYKHIDRKTRPSQESDAEYCDTLDKVISYLASKGFQVHKVCLRWADYAINSKPFTASQLLIFVNRLRYESGLKPFVVAGYYY